MYKGKKYDCHCNIFSFIKKKGVTRKKQNIKRLHFHRYVLLMMFVNDKCFCYQKHLPEIFIQKVIFFPPRSTSLHIDFPIT